ncbi:MAG: anthranilate phosphoribosyltransferase, partial [Candidatus Sericytochromatia bacterium]|nr:anthranilate phosphoribosyltransferase [Candidatus Tanganyikabacteria bacterium]
PSAQMLGVFRADLQDLVAGALAQLPSPRRALVVHGHGGLDELTLSGPSRAIEVREGRLREMQVDPAELGLNPAPLAALLGGDAAQNSEIVRRVISGQDPGPRTDVVLLNAAAALYIGNKAENLRAGMQLAHEAIASGAAVAKLEALTRCSLNW